MSRGWEIHNLILESLEDCPAEIDLLAVDCLEDPCLVLVDGGNEYWWNELPLCQPLYDEYHRANLPHWSTKVDCPNGGKRSISGTSIPLTPETAEEKHPFRSLERRVARQERWARIDEIVARVGCPQND